MSSQGYCGSSYDRYVGDASDISSTLHKMKGTYWTTKQAVIQKLGKKEDQHVVASDAELDGKLEVFRVIQQTTRILLNVVKKYQDRLYAIAQQENAMGRYLKSQCSRDKTRAGKIMKAVGNSQSLSAQERLALRHPLERLYQEVETFQFRAISDTLVTVRHMEEARTEYRGALMWMKKESEDLDPDTYKQLEKFRKVQCQVRKTKQRFDKLKLDVMQKVDLLAASRCNMFSHVLDNYQSTLGIFCKKSSTTLAALAQKFQGYQYYEFDMLKELRDTSRKLAEESNGAQDDLSDVDDVSDDELIDISEEVEPDEQNKESTDGRGKDKQLDRNQEEQKSLSGGEDGGDFGPVLAYQEDEVTVEELHQELLRAQSLLNTVKSPLDVQQGSFLTRDSGLPARREPDLDPDPEDYSVLIEIFNAPSTGEDEFTQEWQAVFGAPMTVTPNTVPAERDPSCPEAEFMPSSLLDTRRTLSFRHCQDGEEGDVRMVDDAPVMSSARQPLASTSLGAATVPSPPPLPPVKVQEDRSVWFSMFADLDPLSNPDAIGCKSNDGMENL